MKRTSATYWSRSRGGATLIEALVGTALLGSLLVSILIAGGRLNAQSGRSGRRIEAVRIADSLLEEWWSEKDKFPRADSAEVEGKEGWWWRTSKAESESVKQWSAEVVALEVFSKATADQGPLVRVEVLLPRYDLIETP